MPTRIRTARRPRHSRRSRTALGSPAAIPTTMPTHCAKPLRVSTRDRGPDRVGCRFEQILRAAAAACSGPDQHVITADPTFESLGRYASVRRATVTRSAAHRRLPRPAGHALAAGGNGLGLRVQSNNPTASLTSTAELTAFLEHVPPSVILVDGLSPLRRGHAWICEHDAAGGAPIPISSSPVPSKIYGMAGLRCGYSWLRRR